MRKRVNFIVLALFFVFSSTAYAISVNPMDSPENLAQAILGSGVTISNVSYTGAYAASGYFSDGGVIGIDSGIVLTSGYASNLNDSSNDYTDITGDNQLPGTPELDALIPGYYTLDATILEFDFETTEDTVYFNYVFGSEEYNEYVGTEFNDVFGFFIDGTNYALLPGTTTPVSINNVNNGMNASFYNDNNAFMLTQLGLLTSPYPFEYDGFTDVLTTTIGGLTSGETYHIKLAIADAGDYILDSGIFIQGGTFSTEPPQEPVPEPATIFLLGSGLFGVAYSRRKKRQ